jgi:hypothetical protein
MLVCSTCNKKKEESFFYKRDDRPKGYTSSCKECRSKKIRDAWTPRKQSAYKLKANYGLTVDEYKSMLAEQNNVCAICKKPETAKSNGGYIKSLAVDHCHSTGEVRGLLCHHCNTGLGKFKDDIELLKSAIEYLKEKI